jgi:hypothetical protein
VYSRRMQRMKRTIFAVCEDKLKIWISRRIRIFICNCFRWWIRGSGRFVCQFRPKNLMEMWFESICLHAHTTKTTGGGLKVLGYVISWSAKKAWLIMTTSTFCCNMSKPQFFRHIMHTNVPVAIKTVWPSFSRTFHKTKSENMKAFSIFV